MASPTDYDNLYRSFEEPAAPDWSSGLAEEAERASEPDPVERDYNQKYAPSHIARESNRKYSEGGLSAKHQSLYNIPKTDPDETHLTEEDLDPAAMYSMAIPGAEAPTEDNPEGWNIKDGVNFLFGDDLAILGLKWDQDGLNWAIENSLDQWSEHPIMSSIAAAGMIASIAFPVVGAVRKSAKVGQLAIRGTSKFIPEHIQKARMIDKQAATKGLLESSQLEHGDDWVRTLDDLLKVEHELGTGLKHFGTGDAAKLKEMLATGRGAEAISHVGIGGIKQRLLNIDHRRRFEQLRWKIDFGKATKLDAMKFNLQKRFANDYFMIGAGMTPNAAKNITEFLDNAQFRKLFSEQIIEEHHPTWFRYMQGLIDETDEAVQAIGKKNPKEIMKWQSQLDAYKQVQSEMVSSGFYAADEIASASLPDPSRHVKVETVGAAVARGLYTSTLWNQMIKPGAIQVNKAGLGLRKNISQIPATLTSPSLQKRMKYGDPAALEAGIEAGEIITDPALVNQFSLVHDKLLLNTYDFMADSIVKHRGVPQSSLNKWFLDNDAFEALTPSAKGRWVNLNDLGGEIAARYGISGANPLTNRLRRMVAVKSGKKVDSAGNIVDGLDDLPHMNVEIFNDFFHPEEGMFGAMSYSTDALSLLTAVFKTGRTALNPATHMTNLSGNFVMLAMAGMNPFSKQAITDGSRMTKVFRQVAKGRIDTEIDSDLLFSKSGLIDVFDKAGVDTMMTTKLGTTIDLTDDFSHPLVQQLIEKNAFETTEGFANLQNTFTAIEAAAASSAGSPLFAKNFTKAMLKFIGDEPGKKKSLVSKSLHHMSSLYLQEDMVPKAMYFMKLRRGGHSIESAVMEVGRRLPQYKNVGNSIKGLRKMAFPWITFPVEMTRIMKNNIMDFPLRTAAILRIPNAMQWAMSEAELAPGSPQEVKDGMRQAPLWAQRGTSVLLNSGQTTGAMLGGSSAAFLGAVFGGANWGTIGAMVGAIGGGAAGAAAGYAFGDEDEANMRAWSMEFLPWSSLMAGSSSPEAEPNDLARMVDLSPIEPFSIITPMVRLFYGKGSWGEEIPVTGKSDAMSKAVMQLTGLLMPSLMQKYGLKVGDPDVGFFNLADNRGMLGAAAVGGLLGAAGGGPVGAAIGAGAGILTGANTIRLQEDLGLVQNSKTGKRGNIIYDLLLNSFMGGTGKSWGTTPEQQLFHEGMQNKKYTKARNVFVKNIKYAILNGDEEMFNDALGKIERSFFTQHADVRTGLTKFGKWADGHMDDLGKHPRLGGMSIEQLRTRLWDAIEFAKEHRGKAADNLVMALKKELLFREMNKENSGMNVGGYNFNTKLASKLLGPAMFARKSKKKKKSRSKKYIDNIKPLL